MLTLVISGVGWVMLTGWAFELQFITSPTPDWIAMKANTAVGFILSGAALWLLQRRGNRAGTRWMVRVLALAILSLATLTLSQYLFSWDLGIDQLLLQKPTENPNTLHPGRMAPNSALCFVVTGLALLLLSKRQNKPFLVIDGAAALMATVGVITVIGYLVDAVTSYQWWEFNGMTFLTALGFVTLGAGLISVARKEEKTAWAIERKLQIAFFCGLFMILSLIGMNYASTGRLQETAQWVAQTHSIRFHTSQLLSAIQDVEQGHRSYLLTGEPGYLEIYESGVKTIPDALSALHQLTSNTSQQQQQIKVLQEEITNKLAFAARTLAVRHLEGAQAAVDMVHSGKGQTAMARVRGQLARIDDGQGRLVELYQAKSNNASTMAFGVLPIAGTLSLTILFMVFFLLNREVLERKQAEKALQGSESRFRGMAENMPQIVWTAQPDGWMDYYNTRWFAYTGLNLAQTQDFGWKHAIHPNDLPLYINAWRKAVENGNNFEQEHRIKRLADGTYRWHIGRADPLRDESGHITKWIGTSTDIDDTRRLTEEIRQLNSGLEERVRERTAQLEAANKELESFSYSVSHDLRAPLRHVQGFADLLIATAASDLSDKTLHYLKTIHEASTEMGRLIDDLLAFSRLSRIDTHENVIALDELVKDVIRCLEPVTQNRHIAWRIAPLPEVLGDLSLLKIVFMNLIDNAIKYSQGRETASIEIGCAGVEGDRCIAFVRDNGAGFDMRYAHKLFGVFQRLHRSDEFEGTGIGLATVQRILARQGGRIWADSSVNQGATFYLTLKPAPEA